MQTIAVLARKGGAGKTTVAAHLALAGSLRGLKALLVDADPQGDAIQALRPRRAPGPGLLAASGAKLFATQSHAQRCGYELVVIDTPAGAPSGSIDAIRIADLVLVVIRPGYLDLLASVISLELARRLGRRAAVVINQAPAAREGIECPAVRNALAILAHLKADVLPTMLRSRLAYQQALAGCRSVEEDSDAAAAAEIAALWTSIRRLAPTATAGESRQPDWGNAPSMTLRPTSLTPLASGI